MDSAAVGNAFVNMYFQILHQSPELVHRFYKEKSKLSRPDSNGDLFTVTTAHAISEMILATVDYSEFKAEIQSVDTQESYNDGVIVLVTGYITAKDFIKKDFIQTFFLAPQDKGFYVLNDIFRYTVSEDQVEIVSPCNCCNQGKKERKTKKEEVIPKEPPFSCPICMSDIVSPFSTTCGHIFCEQCIKTAIQVQKICPTCRAKLYAKNSIHKVILPAVFTLYKNEQGKKERKTKKEEVIPKEPTFSCPLCMSDIVSPFSTTSCGHIFCEQCIKTAIQVQKTCPTCRAKLSAKNSIQVQKICPTCRAKLPAKNSIHKVILPAVSDRSPI